MHILLYAFIIDVLYVKTVLGLEIERRYQVDLIEGLHFYNTAYDGVLMDVAVHSFAPAILLQGDTRQLQLSEDVYERATRLLSSSNEFTLLATLQQEEKNAGSIIAFSDGNNRFLELQSSARKDEIRLHYTHRDVVHVEVFPYRLSDGLWHRLAVTISGNLVTVLVDCNRIYERVIKDVDRNFVGRNLSLWLGQRNSKHFLFKGGLQDVRIVVKEHGYLMQCPQLDSTCPTCGQFRQLQMSVVHLENYIKELTDRLVSAEIRISQVEQCECQKSCRGNGSHHQDGATWKQGCDICSCQKGQVNCRPIQCPQTLCKNPVHNPGECCPACLKQCLLKGVLYDHGEQISPRECIDCTCTDGSMHCQKMNPEQQCSKLTCPLEEQFSVPGECCKFCPGVDYCAQGHNCHVNASCVNLRTRSTCQCNQGFQGDGVQCQDVDECAKIGGHDGHHCQSNTQCVNLLGAYSCECLSGYNRIDTYNCDEHDECRSGDHLCHKDAVCINTAGSYHCQCKVDFKGDGFSCDPVCSEPCLNGGKCTAPGICTCRKGYVGPSCEIDVDECSLEIHQCHPNSYCVNLPGWYYCECRTGYYSFQRENNLGILCQDIDECEDGSHTCHGTAKCVNIDGSFTCQCQNTTVCSLNCIFDGIERRNGSLWSTQNNSCTKCSCQNGIVKCEHDQCDCSNSRVNLDCCPHCDQTSRCQHQELPTLFQNGQSWIYQCQQCECLYGEIDCWPINCPPSSCDSPSLIDGDCCRRCEDDPCSWEPQDSSQTTTDGSLDNITAGSTLTTLSERGCTYMGQRYDSGQLWETSNDHCTTCKCKNGHLCCSFSSNCSRNVATVEIVALVGHDKPETRGDGVGRTLDPTNNVPVSLTSTSTSTDASARSSSRRPVRTVIDRMTSKDTSLIITNATTVTSSNESTSAWTVYSYGRSSPITFERDGPLRIINHTSTTSSTTTSAWTVGRRP